MKKLPFLLLIAFAFFSCGKSSPDPEKPKEEQPPQEEQPPKDDGAALLPIKIVTKANGETKTYTLTYKEKSNELLKISRTDGWEENYIYDKGLIKKIYRGDSESESTDYNVFTYQDNKVIKKEDYRTENENPETINVSYSGKKSTVSVEEGEDMMVIEIEKDGKGNPETMKVKLGDASAELTATFNECEDPFSNVKGWMEMQILPPAPLGDNIDYEDVTGSPNNPVKIVGTFMDKAVSIDYTYEYNESKNKKLPTKILGTKKVGSDTQTFEVSITYN